MGGFFFQGGGFLGLLKKGQKFLKKNFALKKREKKTRYLKISFSRGKGGSILPKV